MIFIWRYGFLHKATNADGRTMKTELILIESSPSSPGVAELLDALSNELALRTGRDGRSSFAEEDLTHPRAILMVAVENGEAVGCGAIRPMAEKICELKRMFAKKQNRGIGRAVLAALEARAKAFGYESIWLETGCQNKQAIGFYLKHGYRIRENYGKYAGRPECICFEKNISVLAP